MEIIYQSESPEITKMIGTALGQILRKLPCTILMTGELGAGKTTMTQAVVAGYGIDTYVSSPTYTLVNVYENDERKLYHFDLYRLNDPDELSEIGFDEFTAENVPMIIEWPEMVSEYGFAHRLDIRLSYGDDANSRIIALETDDRELEEALDRFG